MSGTFSGDSQATTCETSREFPAAPEPHQEYPKDLAARIDAARSQPTATTPSSAAGNGSPRDDQQATGTEVAGTPSPAPKTSEKASDERSLTAAELRAYIAALNLTKLTFAQKKGLLDGLAAKERYEAENMLERYAPYPKQLEFHAAGKTNRERLLMAGNQLGKTYSAAAETAFHLTGLYPDDWGGYVFSRPTRGLAAGVTSQLVRDSMQVLLCGAPAKALGEGMIPKRCIESEPVMARSITGAYDTVKVKHVSGGESTLYLRAYEQGREKVQAMTLDFVWLDEEPDSSYYLEALTRTNVAAGPVYMTFTPLKGMSETVGRFLLEGQGHVTTMTINDVDHYTQAQRDAIIAQYPAHEREARTQGTPTFGSGKVFPVLEPAITVEPFPIPDHWPRLAALDLGWQHPTAVVWLTWDRDADTVYVYDAHRAKETLIPVHAAAIKARGDWIPCSWPHDGHQIRDAMHGEQLAEQYRREGVNMRHTHAQLPETGHEGERAQSRISTEAGIQELLTRMETGRFKVFSHLGGWFEEFRMYHRKDGVIVKVRDDLMSATRIGIFDLRFAELKPSLSRSIDHERRSDGLY
jgi:phage terminase large subunit-like protein